MRATSEAASLERLTRERPALGCGKRRPRSAREHNTVREARETSAEEPPAVPARQRQRTKLADRADCLQERGF